MITDDDSSLRRLSDHMPVGLIESMSSPNDRTLDQLKESENKKQDFEEMHHELNALNRAIDIEHLRDKEQMWVDKHLKKQREIADNEAELKRRSSSFDETFNSIKEWILSPMKHKTNDNLPRITEYRIRLIFKALDKDENGRLELEEFKLASHLFLDPRRRKSSTDTSTNSNNHDDDSSYSKNYRDSELEKLFQIYDVSHLGYLNYQQFRVCLINERNRLIIMKKKDNNNKMNLVHLEAQSLEDLRRLFRKYDTNNDDEIDFNEFRLICESLNYAKNYHHSNDNDNDNSDDQISLLFDDLDTDKNGCIDFAEFCQGFFGAEISDIEYQRLLLLDDRTEEQIRKAFAVFQMIVMNITDDDETSSIKEVMNIDVCGGGLISTEDIRITNNDDERMNQNKKSSNKDALGTFTIDSFIDFCCSLDWSSDHSSKQQCISEAKYAFADAGDVPVERIDQSVIISFDIVLPYLIEMEHGRVRRLRKPSKLAQMRSADFRRIFANYFTLKKQEMRKSDENRDKRWRFSKKNNEKVDGELDDETCFCCWC